ncbi:MAG: SLBB domain-containing protein [Verrucomicrobia bacterium]|nr:SLBB domain-containing protein [Verrucomicrobiota bacterium]
MNRPSLNISEWLVITLFLSLMVAMALISKLSSAKAQEIIVLNHKEDSVKIEISGEVHKPGIYEFEAGVTYAEALKRARPKRFADVSNLRLEDAVQGARIIVPGLEAIRIRVSGEVKQSGELIVPVGTRVCDLKSKIELTAEGDPKVFSRRKILADGEKIQVPKRK